MDKREALIEACADFLATVRDLTPGPEVERWLNEQHGPGSAVYEDLARRAREGLAEGWAANIDITGPHYRRSRISEPTEKTQWFSITTVLMDSMANGADAAHRFRGDYHGHPYGELNLVMPLNEGAQLMGPAGWCGAGWTAPGPGTKHYPEVRGGAVLAMFFLPAGRISYDENRKAGAGAQVRY